MDTATTNEPWKDIKQRHIYSALNSDPVDIKILQHCALTRGGLLSNDLRKRVWPKLLGVDVYHIKEYEGPPLNDHKDKAQVMLDVNRCGRRIPEELNESEQKLLQNRIARVILRILSTNSNLCYYQGLHDVTLTILLVIDDDDISYAVLNMLVQYHLRDFLDVNMKYTKQVIGYIDPLLALVHNDLQEFILRSECQYYFSLSWLITWFSHNITDPDSLNRLFDFFLSSHPIMSVYYSASIILSRRDEILAEECEMSSVHSLISNLPTDLDTEQMITNSYQLYNDYPVNMVAKYGRLRLNDSYLNWNNKRFERMVDRQRPDRVLQNLSHEAMQHNNIVTMVTYSVPPVLIGILIYWLIRSNYHYKLFQALANIF